MNKKFKLLHMKNKMGSLKGTLYTKLSWKTDFRADFNQQKFMQGFTRAPAAGVVPGTALGAMDFVGEAFGDGWGHRDTCPGGQFLGRNIQQNIFQWECSGPAYLTLQLRDLTHVFCVSYICR